MKPKRKLNCIVFDPPMPVVTKDQERKYRAEIRRLQKSGKLAEFLKLTNAVYRRRIIQLRKFEQIEHSEGRVVN